MEKQAGEIMEKIESDAEELFVPADRFDKHMRDVFDVISQRAYERFESRGRVHGHDWQDWFGAESALLQAVSHEVSDSGDAFVAVVDIAAYRLQDLRMSAEPKRLRICGHRAGENGGAEVSGHTTKHPRAFRLSYEFPAPINAAKASAEIRGELLEVRLPKVTPSRRGIEQRIAEAGSPPGERIGLRSAG
jgi:HSP20 family molecular chaperone IbpA